MSAFILEDDTLDLLVSAGLHGVGADARLEVFHEGEWHQWNKYENADALGSILKTENYKSVNYRYQEATPCEPYRYSGEGIVQYLGSETVLPWAQVLASLDCYEYQTCEHPEWETSLAKAICDRIRRKVCRIISREAETEWVWTREDAQERMAEIRANIKAQMVRS